MAFALSGGVPPLSVTKWDPYIGGVRPIARHPLVIAREAYSTRKAGDASVVSARDAGSTASTVEDNRGTDQPARADQARTQTGDHPIGRAEIGRPFSRPIQDQQLVLHEHGFGHDSAGAAGPSEPSNGRQQMQK